MKYLLLSLQLVVLPLLTTANIKYTSISKKTEISYTGAYTTLIELKGKSSDENTLPLYFSALEKISVTEVKTSLSPNKWDRQKKKEHKIEDAPSNSFYSGAQMIRIEIPENSEFIISYTLSCTESKMLCRMDFNFYEEVDSVIYQINVPSIYQLSWDQSSFILPELIIDSIQIPYQVIYSFKVGHQEKIDKCRKKLLYTVYNKNINEQLSLVNWYRHLLSETNGIGDNEFLEITSEISTTDTLQFILEVFNKVRKKISYIDFEAGYGAWQPRPANQIIQNKKGDCKDMANVLFQVFKKKNITAYMGLISTTSKADYSFPTIASFNHAICIVQYQGIDYVLDATDKNNPIAFPSRHTQGHTAFCISDSTFRTKKIPEPSAELNTKNNSIKITETDSGIFGKWIAVMKGYEASEYNDLLNSYSEKDALIQLQKHFSHASNKMKVTQIEILHKSLDSVILSVNFKLEGGLFIQSKESRYIHMKNIPFFYPPIPLEGECHYFHSFLSKNNTTITLAFKTPINNIKIKPVIISNTIATFKGSFQTTNLNTIEFTYDYSILQSEMNESENSEYTSFRKKVIETLSSTYEL